MKEKYQNINQDLIDACKQGKQKAQFELYKQYASAMYNTCFRILKDSAEAEDAMQEGFLKAFQHISEYSGTVSFGAWLKKILVNTSLDALRKRKVEFFDIDEVKMPVLPEEQPEDDDGMQYQVKQVKKAMLALPDGYRVVLSLYLLEGYDHDEIGEIMGVSASTSRSQLARAKKRLVELLKNKS